MNTKLSWLRAALGLALAAVAMVPFVASLPVAEAATLTVTKTADTNDGTCDSDCSLREAINASSAGDTVSVPAGSYFLTIAGIGEDAGTTGDLDIAVDLTIEGAGSVGAIVDANGIDRVLHATSGADLTLRGLTVRGGDVAGFGGGILASGSLVLDDVTVTDNNATQGGGISVSGELDLLDSRVSANTATGQGGGISAGTSFTITNSDVIDNMNDDQGAGIFVNVGSGQTVSYLFDGAEVAGNIGTDQGGGFFFNGNFNTEATVFIEDSVFDGNSAGTNDGGGMFWNVNSGGATTIAISNSTFTNNSAGGGGGIYVNSGGGADDIVIVDSTIDGNQASSGDGGGLYFSNFAATITGSTFSGNDAVNEFARGGGIYAYGLLYIGNSTLSGNSAGEGAGIFSDADDALIEASTISGNTATGPDDDGGGGIYNNETMLLLNSTVSGNTTARHGGGVYNDFEMEIVHSTIADNDAAIFGDQIFNDNTLSVANTIISGSETNCGGDPDEGGPNVTSLGNNIDSGTSCELSDPGDMSNTDPMLGALAANGGATLTRALLAGSPAVDEADDEWCPEEDQRGIARPVGADCDIGAFEGESEGEAEPTATATRTATPTRTPAPESDGDGDIGGAPRNLSASTLEPTTAAPSPAAPVAIATTAPGGGVAPGGIGAPNTGSGPDDGHGRLWFILVALASLSGLVAAAGIATGMQQGR